MSNSPQYELNGTATQEKRIPVTAEISSEQLAHGIAEAADDKKASDIVLLKVSEISYLADYFIVATGFSATQVKAICDSIEEQIEAKYQLIPLRVQGKTDGRWVVVDYGEVIVHIFMQEEREYYNLEAFWGHAERIEFSAT
ncbi:Ribosomal silencing factor RsfS [Hyella patelloides LEGE 07179]|uniref:Ribosomal silencing factor RsfS n=1 Tax=Hyella patelloides LEGE 07179 TaxID=945734 RepID=A0A563VKM0_9CYAN|nr:ribosome silencing factor [Hyella patelloides]VEP11989.1 Ribosomal silencing factor RsfS [Hyella patelloides LEGE 07179]